MSADVEAIAKAWMAHQGYSPDDIEVAETDTHEARGCYFAGTSWCCFDEYGNSNHPAWDVLEEATEMARVAIEALEATHAIVELPKPANVIEAEWNGEWVDGIITAHFGSGKVRCYLEDPRMTSDDAREIGAGLIAAAAAADRSEVPS